MIPQNPPLVNIEQTQPAVPQIAPAFPEANPHQPPNQFVQGGQPQPLQQNQQIGVALQGQNKPKEDQKLKQRVPHEPLEVLLAQANEIILKKPPIQKKNIKDVNRTLVDNYEILLEIKKEYSKRKNANANITNSDLLSTIYEYERNLIKLCRSVQPDNITDVSMISKQKALVQQYYKIKKALTPPEVLNKAPQINAQPQQQQQQQNFQQQQQQKPPQIPQQQVQQQQMPQPQHLPSQQQQQQLKPQQPQQGWQMGHPQQPQQQQQSQQQHQQGAPVGPVPPKPQFHQPIHYQQSQPVPNIPQGGIPNQHIQQQQAPHQYPPQSQPQQQHHLKPAQYQQTNPNVVGGPQQQQPYQPY